jgi:hypothetical protein
LSPRRAWELGCLGIGFLVDLIMIITGSFYDKAGKPVISWVRTVDADGKVLNYYG